MKYLIKLKKRHFKKLTKVLPKKRNQIDHKKLILKKVPKKTEKKSRAYTPFDSPYNSNEYLIKNRSSPFFDDDDEEKDQFPCQPLELIGIDDEIINLDLFLYNMDSTMNDSDYNIELKEEINKKKEIFLESDKK